MAALAVARRAAESSGSHSRVCACWKRIVRSSDVMVLVVKAAEEHDAEVKTVAIGVVVRVGMVLGLEAGL